MVQTVRLTELPDIALLRAAAAAEGYAHMETLVRDWESGAERFDKDGCALFGVYADGDLVGIGGVTREPTDPNGDVLRARRLYVLPHHRGRGVGASLVGAIVQEAFQNVSTLTVGRTKADKFWRKMGFSPVCDERGLSHCLKR
ncbi:MAG: GNAT family N-acetyltransferase [Alphaproteobacteria bacterium]|nr:GNAT family N-acetyltransferase [Alphaproteobacteria bacterium]